MLFQTRFLHAHQGLRYERTKSSLVHARQLLRGPLAQRGESAELLNLASDTKVK